MANQDHVNILKQGVDVWNQWRAKQREQSRDDGEQHVVQPDLSGEYLRGITMEGADLSGANLENIWLKYNSLSKANLTNANLKGAYLRLANFKEADLRGADLSGATLDHADLQKANLAGAHLEGTSFREASLASTNLNNAFFDSTTALDGSRLGDKDTGFVYLADVHWNDANLAVVDWSFLEMLGEEQDVRQRKDKFYRLQDHQNAVRAYRQLTVALRNQGMYEIADRFGYRAQVLQRAVFRLQTGRMRGMRIPLHHPQTTLGRRVHMLFSWLFSWLLCLLAGYGYRPERSLLWYLIIISSFTVAYSRLGGLPFLPDSLVFSLMSFHGRGFFPSLSSETNLHNPIVELAAIEAIVGLFIEISFIATFTQRFFGK